MNKIKTNNVRIALVGLGYWGKNLLRNFYDLGVLAVCCDNNSDTLKERNQKFPELKYTTCFDDVLKDQAINAVAISTPAATHYDLVKKALIADKHVFVEKPLAMTVKEGEYLVRLAEKKNKILMIGHILHYHPAVIKLKDLIEKGEIGKIQYFYSNRVSLGKLRSEENILWSFGPHDISMILFLLDEFPRSISASGGSYVQHDVADVTLTSLEFSRGVKGHIFISWLHPFKEQKLVIVGDKNMAVFNDTSEEKLLLYSHEIKWVQGAPFAHAVEPEVISVDNEEPLRNECKHFCDCIRNSSIPYTDGHEGLRVLRVLQASQESLNNKGLKIIYENPEKI